MIIRKNTSVYAGSPVHGLYPEMHGVQMFVTLWKILEKSGRKWKIIPNFAPDNDSIL